MRFGAVGAIGTAAHYAVLIWLVEMFEVNVVLATTMGFFVGAIVNYALSFRTVFGSTQEHTVALPRFLTVAALTGALNAAIMWTLTSMMPVHYLLAQLVATGIAFFCNYAFNSLWTFRSRTRRPVD